MPRISSPHGSIFRLRSLERVRCVIDKRVAHEPIESPRSDRIRQADIGLVAQDDHAHVPVRLKADIGTKTGRSSIVPNDGAVWGLRNDPAERVRVLFIDRHFWRPRHVKIFGRD